MTLNAEVKKEYYENGKEKGAQKDYIFNSNLRSDATYASNKLNSEDIQFESLYKKDKISKKYSDNDKTDSIEKYYEEKRNSKFEISFKEGKPILNYSWSI